jgi:CDP-2,3-bis-(O-geranylgeranyl)-sn-glycerol synthase
MDGLCDHLLGPRRPSAYARRRGWLVIEPIEIVRALYFFIPAYLANITPVLVRGHFEALAAPIDGGRSWRGIRILGDHKTWRGLICGVAAATATFALQRALYDAGVGHGLTSVDCGTHVILPGVLMGLGTGVGDAVKSFFKRRVGIVPGATWLGFDQVDFLFGAYVFVAPMCAPPLAAAALCLPVVFLGSIATTVIGYALGLKESWI